MSMMMGVLLAAMATAQERPDKPEMQIQVKQMNLSAQVGAFGSGLTVLAMPDATSPMVATTVVVDAGWRYDPADRRGVARLFERLWWRSEVAPGVTVLDQLTRGYGCEVDSGVDHDVVRFASVCPSTSVDAAMRVWARLFTAPLAGVDGPTLVVEAARLRDDQRGRALLTEHQLPGMMVPLYGQLFPTDHPYHQPAAPALDGLGVEDVAAWASKHVTGGRATVSVIGDIGEDHPLHGPALVAGNFDPKTLDARLKPEHLARWPKGDDEVIDPDDLSLSWGWPADPTNPTQGFRLMAPPAARALKEPLAVPAPAGAPFQRVQGGVDHPTVLVGWALPPGWRDDDATQAVAARLVAGIIAKHLDDPAIERMLGCFTQPGLESTTLLCGVQLKDDQALAGERIGGRVVDQITYVTDVNNRLEVEGALAAAQQSIFAETLSQLDELGGIGGSKSYWFSAGTHFTGNAMYWSKRIAAVGRVNIDDAVKFVATHVTRQRSRALQIDPAPSTGGIPRLASTEARDRDAHAALPPYFNAYATHLAPPPVPAARIDAARLAATARPIDASRLSTRTLSNGLKVVVVPLGEAPVVHARLVAGIGRVDDPTPQMLHLWSGKMAVFRRQPADAIGGAWYAWLGDAVQVLGIRASTDNLGETLWLLRDGLENSNASTRAKVTETASFRALFGRQLHDPGWFATRGMKQHLLSDSPLGREPGWAELEAWGKVSLTELGDLLKTQWRPDNVTLLIVGGVDPDEAQALAEAHFKGWTVGAPSTTAYAAKPVPLAPLPSAARIELLDAPTGDAADVVFACRVDAGEAPRRVMEELVRRGVADHARGVIVSSEAWEGGTAVLELRAQVAASDVGAAVAGLRERVQAGASGALPVDEVKHAALVAASAVGALSTSDVRAVAWLTDRLADGLPLADDTPVPHDLAALRAAFGTCAAAPYVAVIGDAAAAGPSLQAAGVTAATVDWRAEGEATHAAKDPTGFKRWQKLNP